MAAKVRGDQTTPMRQIRHLTIACLVLTAITSAALGRTSTYVNWESPQTHSVEVTPNGATLLVVNTPDNRLEVFDVAGSTFNRRGSVSVGLDPVSVRARSNTEAWVVNQISDSVSVVDLTTLRVTRTISVGDEPADVAFAGSPQRAFVSLPLTSSVVVLDPANAATAAQTVAIQGASPRAMAVSPDGSKVYLAIFESGNHSTIIPETIVNNRNGPYAGANPPPNAGTGFSPAISSSLPTPPKVAHVARKNASNRWIDGNGRDWTSLITWDVLDNDLAVITANSLATTYVKGFMTIVAGVAVSPTSGNVVAVGVESRNELRYSANVNSVFIRSMMATIPSGSTTATSIDLNPHLTYTQTSIPDVSKDASIGDPRGVVVAADGTTYVAGLGSNNVIVTSGTGTRVDNIAVGEGPTGLALSGNGARLFVLNRFEGSLSIVSTSTRTEIGRLTLHDPTPADVKAGRPFLYDTHRTSGLGQASCASCHVDGRSDRLGWDLGDPQGTVKLFDQSCQVPGCTSWHPMKGYMTTQTLVGIIGNEPFHWRGEKRDLSEFNEAYTHLQGRSAEITTAEMSQLTSYLGSLTFPPNPNRNMDNSLKSSVTVAGGFTGNPVAGQTVFNTSRLFGAPPGLTCVACHAGTPGSNNVIDIPGAGDDQNRKNAPLRDSYRKVGADRTSQTAKYGFGFDHAGEDSTIQNVLSVGFNFPAGTTGTTQKRDIEAYVLSFGSDTHAAVGVQTTASNAGGSGDNAALITQMLTLANAGSVGLVVKGMQNGEQRGWMLIGGRFQSDRRAESITPSNLLARAAVGSELTYTVVPAGSQERIGVDRDADGFYDGDEMDAGSDAANGADTPQICRGDLDGSGAVDSGDVAMLLLSWGEFGGPADQDRSGVVDAGDLALIMLDFGACAN